MTTDLNQIGERIKGLRDALGYSPEKMASILEQKVDDYLA